MNGDALLAALDLPAGSRVDQRVPKKLLLENAAPTAADKRIISNGVEELLWVAALKPTTIGVPEYRNDVREYLEIAVLCLRLRDAAKVTRLAELVHRSIPYPALVLADNGDYVAMSAAHKRWSLGESGGTVLDGPLVVLEWDVDYDGSHDREFLNALAISRQPTASLLALYQGWVDTIFALEAARLSGHFRLMVDPQHAAARREAVANAKRLIAEITRLRGLAERERKLRARVDLNVRIRTLETEYAVERSRLQRWLSASE